MRFLANLLYVTAAALYLPALCYQMVVQGKNRRGWRERFGHWPIGPGDRPRIWIHAVSLGEINATPLLVEKLEARLPDYDVVISTTTDTGFARACKLYGRQRVFRFPLDFSWVVDRVLARVQPSLIVLVELEVWHNLVRTATAKGIPVVVVNGRLTERSRRRFGRLGRWVRPMFADLAWVGAQDGPIAARFMELGVPPGRVEITGSVKWDTTTVADTVDGAGALAAALGIDAAVPLWVCGSTGPGEEAIILDAYGRLVEAGTAIRLAIIPRKPERFDEVDALIRSRGYPCIRRSRHADDCAARSSDAAGITWQSARTEVRGSLKEEPSGWPIILGDTMGELRKFYSLARVVFVGRSLVTLGGSDPMEAAALAKPIIVGPHMDNFAGPVAALADAGAVRLVDGARSLAAAVVEFCATADDSAGAAARQVVLDHQGATERTAQRLAAIVRAGRAPAPGGRRDRPTVAV